MFVGLGVIAVGCTGSGDSSVEIRRLSLDDTTGVIDAGLVTEDTGVSADGGGSLRIDARGPMTVRLFALPDIDLENAKLNYRLQVRTEGVQGTVYPEMWCQFAGMGEYFSRGLQNQLSGTSDWTMLETPFFLKEGENPDTVRLNMVITGPGTVWIDDIRLDREPLGQVPGASD
jgi:hypothetical protein